MRLRQSGLHELTGLGAHTVHAHRASFPGQWPATPGIGRAPGAASRQARIIRPNEGPGNFPPGPGQLA